MAIIPKYEQQISVSASNVPTKVGVTDTTTSGLTEKAIGKVGVAIGENATVLELVRQKQEKQKQADTDIALDEIYQAEESKGLAFATAIKTAEGADRLKLYEDFQNWNNSHKDPKGNPLNLNNIDEGTATYHGKILKKNGYTPEQEAKFNIKMGNLKDRVYSHVYPSIIEARENIAIQTTQESIKNSQLKMLNGMSTVGETNAGIVLEYDGKTDISPETKKILIQDAIQSNTKLFIENEMDKDVPSPQVIADFKAGKYDGYILAGKDGVNKLDTLRNQVSKAEQGLKVEDAVSKYMPDTLIDPFDQKTKDKTEASIKADKKLTTEQQRLVISRIDIEVNKQQQAIRETRTEGHRKEEDVFFNLVNNKQTGTALRALNKFKFIDEKEKYAYRKMLEEGNGSFPKSNAGVLANYQYRILKDAINVSEDEILKDLNLHPKDKIDLIKERTAALTKEEKPELVSAMGKLKDYADSGILIGVEPGAAIPTEKIGENGAKHIRLQRALREAVNKGEDADIALERLTKVDKDASVGGWLDTFMGYASPALSAISGGIVGSAKPTEQGSKSPTVTKVIKGKTYQKIDNQWYEK